MTPSCLSAAYALDWLLGDPEWFPHPVRGFGFLVRRGEPALRRLTRGAKSEFAAGAGLTLAVVAVGWLAGRKRHPAWQVLLAWTVLATRSLLDEAGLVIRALEADDLGLARVRLTRIVGRETEGLDAEGVARAVIETLAESACDGIVAPLFWLAAAGVPGAMAYKAINTLDSMIGHPEAPHRYFGRFAARLDDTVNYLPARATAVCIAAGSKLCGLDAGGAVEIWRRDGDRHASPNAGQSEASMAGALGVRLGGVSSYDGHLHQAPLLHSEGRPACMQDARAALGLVAVVSGIAFGFAILAIAWRRRQ